MENIPVKDLFMMCESLNKSACSQMPTGYTIRYCQKDELDIWKALHIDEPEDYEEYNEILTAYFNNVYAKHGDLFFERCVLACDANGTPVGTCFIWKAYDKINTIHWLKVAKPFEGKGIGRALLSYVMGNLDYIKYPIFLHTHPSSYRAIKLYSDFGFSLLTNPQIGFRQNDFEECLPILKSHMPIEAYENLSSTTAPQFFLDAANSSKTEEF